MSRALSKIRAVNLPRRGLSRSEFAADLDLPESVIDDIVGLGLVPPPSIEDGVEVWDADVVEQSLSSLGLIYAAGFDRYVKIGFTAGDIKDRMATLQNGCPKTLKLYGLIGGSLKSEAELHARFADQRIRPNGEWFWNRGIVSDWIKDVSQ